MCQFYKEPAYHSTLNTLGSLNCLSITWVETKSTSYLTLSNLNPRKAPPTPMSLTMPKTLATRDEGVSALLAFVFSGAIGSPEGKGVSYALAKTTATSFSWVAALEDMDEPPVPTDRYLITFNRLSREILAPRPIVLSNGEKSQMLCSQQRANIWPHRPGSLTAR